MGFSLTPQQQAVVDSRGGALLVSAAAGAGKTRVLVERLMDRIQTESLDIDRFMVITYTNAAAAELRQRIGQEISSRVAAHPNDRHLRRQSMLLYEAEISTIHAFCAHFLKECGYLLEVSPDFRLCDEQQAALLLMNAIGEVLEARYERIESDPDFSLLVDTMSAGRDDSQLIRIALEMRARVQSHPAPEAWLRAQVRRFEAPDVNDIGETLWGRLLIEDAARQAAYWVRRMEACLEIAACDEVFAQNYGSSIDGTIQSLQGFLTAAEQGWDNARAALPIAFPAAGRKKGAAVSGELEQVKLIRNKCKKRLEAVAGSFSDESAPLLEDLQAIAPAVRALVRLLEDLDATYAKEKQRRGLLDFGDLEHLTLRILQTEPQVAARWSERYAEIMVDEYQDTNEVQNAIFSLLAGGGERLFMVGDVKQSIYRFRLADPGIFLEKYRAYPDLSAAEPNEPRRIILSKNYRSRPEVLEGVNYLFQSIMSTECGEMEYTENEALFPGAEFPSGDQYALELNLLDLSAEEEGERTSKLLLEARFAAGRIRSLLDEGLPCVDGTGGLRPVTPSDIVILLRSPGRLRPYYTQALGEYDIPWQAEGSGDFFSATEVSVTLSLLQIIDNPRQDVPLISVLRSPLYGFTAPRLALLRSEAPDRADFFAALEGAAERGEKDCEEFLRDINALRFRAYHKTCYQLLWEIYDSIHLLGIFGALEEGALRQESLLTLAELARNAEASGYRGLYGFLRYLERLRESGTASPISVAGRIGGGVHIMSIHRSKGLEFPVVLLCGLTREFNRNDLSRPILFHPTLGIGPKRLDLERMVEYPTIARQAVARQLEREMLAEEMRLLYVAMTRAKEKLILTCAFPDRTKELSGLLPDAGTPVESQALLGCKSMAQWILLSALPRPEMRPVLAAADLTASLPPVLEPGPAWEIRLQGRDACVPPARCPSEEMTGAPDGGDEEECADLERRLRWRYPYASVTETPSKLTATQLKGRGLDQEIAEESPPSPSHTAPPVRPRFVDAALGLTAAQKGTALHLAMQFISFDTGCETADIVRELERLERQQFLTPEQRGAVEPSNIAAFFASPLGRAVRGAEILRREFKFSVLVPARDYQPEAGEGEEILLQGVIDCFYETTEGLTVVDFKTDHVYGTAVEARAEEYRIQLDTYSHALTEITGKPVAHRILWFFTEGRAVEL